MLYQKFKENTHTFNKYTQINYSFLKLRNNEKNK